MRSSQMRSVVLLATSSCVVACYVPNPAYAGVDTETGDSTESVGASSGEVGGGDGQFGDGDQGRNEDGDGDGDENGNGSACGDGIVAPGEFCFFGVTVLGLPNVWALTIADFDGDGHTDLGVVRLYDVLVLFGGGDGTFLDLVDLPEPLGYYTGIAAGDIDLDGDDDLVVSSVSGDFVSVYLSNGDRSFAPSYQLDTEEGPVAVALARLGPDGLLDLAVVCEAEGLVEVRRGLGGAGFADSVSYPTGDQPRALAVGLVNADAHLDLLVANRAGQALALLTGAGDGSFASALSTPVAGEPRVSVLADFNKDGALDAATVVENLDRAHVLFGNGQGWFAPSGQDLVTDGRPLAAGVGDFDSDGFLDLVVANHDDHTTQLLRGSDVLGELLPAQTLTLVADVLYPRAVAIGDLNGDGVDDLVVGGNGLTVMVSDP